MTPRPTSRPDRLDLLLRVLTDRPGTTAGQLALELGTSVRTVFRDLAALRDRGYPIEGGRGRGGGLLLPRAWGLSRVLLSAEEACGALLGLAIAERLGLPMFSPDLARARRKLVDAFPAAQRRRLAPLRERILIGAPASHAVRASYHDPDPGVIRPLQAALVEERVVLAEYHGASRGPGPRSLEPHAILINWPAWYLLAWDLDRHAARTFRLDRFRSVRVLEPRFRPRPRQLATEALGPDGVPATGL